MLSICLRLVCCCSCCLKSWRPLFLSCPISLGFVLAASCIVGYYSCLVASCWPLFTSPCISLAVVLILSHCLLAVALVSSCLVVLVDCQFQNDECSLLELSCWPMFSLPCISLAVVLVSLRCSLAVALILSHHVVLVDCQFQNDECLLLELNHWPSFSLP